MDIVGLTPAPATITLSGTPATTLLWQLGQRLDAIVVALLGQDKVSLRIGTALVEARTALPAVPGQRLTLEVVQTERQIVLRLAGGTPRADAIKTALRTALPQQLPLQTAFTGIAEAFASSPGLPPAVSALLRQLLQQLPSDLSVTRADTLKQSLMNSGLFLEHKLNTRAPAPQLNNDIKANLLRLLGELNQGQGDAAADLTRHAAAALARVQLQQLAALAQEPPALAWAGELPVRNGGHIDALQFRIEKEAKNGAAGKQSIWCTWLSLHLRTLGPLHAKVTLSDRHIAAAFWAESRATVDLVNENIDHLRDSLERAGLEVKDIRCRQGQPPFPAPDRLPQGLLDLTA